MYLQYFNLKEEPFSVTPDPRFLFRSQWHETALQSLLYGISHRKGFLLLTGEIGTGKTTLCRELINRLGDATDLSVIFNPVMSVPGIIRAINADFGNYVCEKDVEQQLSALNQFLLSRLANGRNAVVIIDEAQNLSVEALEMTRLLSNLETDKKKLLQIVLVGQPELDETLQNHRLRQLNQRICIRQNLEILSFRQMKDYISHRLMVAGGEGQLDFDHSALKKIFAHTKGYPRLTNILCDRILLAAYARRTRTINKKIVHIGIADLSQKTIKPRWRFWPCR
jgi:general secretion pathway protein A